MSCKTLVERWKEEADGLDAGEFFFNEDELRMLHLLSESVNACTPRPPDPSWFGAPFDAEGKATGTWDSWWSDRWGLRYGCRGVKPGVGMMVLTQNGDLFNIRDFGNVLPVLREGYGPAGWQVVEP